MTFKILETTVSADVATNGTITFAYPNGVDAGAFFGAVGHRLNVRKHQTVYDSPASFTVAFGATAVVTYKGTTTIPAGSVVQLQAEMQGQNDRDPKLASSVQRVVSAPSVLVPLGAPVVGVATAVAAAQAVAGAANLTINGTLAVNAAVTFDVPRAVTVVSANAGDTTQTATVYGKDEYGSDMRETLTLNGTTAVTGKKAFKSVSRVAMSALTAGNVSCGSSNVLGLPIFLPEVAFVLKEIQDGVAATAGTTVKADTAKATATTGDVRGTYLPNATPDGAKVFQLVVVAADPQYAGATQFNG